MIARASDIREVYAGARIYGYIYAETGRFANTSKNERKSMAVDVIAVTAASDRKTVQRAMAIAIRSIRLHYETISF